VKKITKLIETNINTTPEDILKNANIPYMSFESRYDPIKGWDIATDQGVITCNEKEKTITYWPNR